MTEAEVHGVVCDVLSAMTGREGPFEPETRLVDQVGLDSLGLLSVTVELENRFELCLEPEEDEPLLCIGDVVRLVLRTQPRGPHEAGRESIA